MLALAAIHGVARVLIFLVGAVIVLAIVVAVVRMYRCPRGPELTMAPVTRKGRERVNRSYAKHGWAEPFDDEGNPIPRSERKLPDY